MGTSSPRAARAALLAIVLAALFAVSPGPANAHSTGTFGHNSLATGCCGGANLYGTRAYITVTYLTLNNLVNCAAVRSDAENTGAASLIQTGAVRCYNDHVGNCFPGTSLLRYVEIIKSGVESCFPHGTISFSTQHRYTVQRTASAKWCAFINGIQYDCATGFFDNATYLIEGGEYTDPSSSCVSQSNFDAFATYSGWDRYNGSSYVSVQSSSYHTDCNWTRTPPPGSWWVDY